MVEGKPDAETYEVAMKLTSVDCGGRSTRRGPLRGRFQELEKLSLGWNDFMPKYLVHRETTASLEAEIEITSKCDVLTNETVIPKKENLLENAKLRFIQGLGIVSLALSLRLRCVPKGNTPGSDQNAESPGVVCVFK